MLNYLLLKNYLKKIPFVTLLYRFTLATLKLPKRIFRKIINILTLKKRKQFEKLLKNWSFDDNFSDLVNLTDKNYGLALEMARKLTAEDRYNPIGYALLNACYELNSNKEHENLGIRSRAIGIELVSQGRLKEGADFFQKLYNLFPTLYEPYALLFSTIHARREEYIKNLQPALDDQKKRLVLSFMVWGDKYLKIFNDYCIPTLLAPGNLPSVSENRDISIDIYAHKEDIKKLKEMDAFESLAKLCKIDFIEFPERLVTCEEYTNRNADFRYTIYGAFHHLSIEKASFIGADVMCLGPDNVYSDKSFSNYVRLLDKGYDAVLFTATRVQAEFILPALDKIKDQKNKVLQISSDKMVEMAAQYIHHSFFYFIVTNTKTPISRSGFFIPYEHGFHIRSFHYHPVIISARALKNNTTWNYMTTVDDSLIVRLFPNAEYWSKLKVITDSRDGIMLDIAYKSTELPNKQLTDLNETYLDQVSERFNENQLWNFQFTVNYQMDKKLERIRAFLYDQDGSLEPKEFPITPDAENIKNLIENWYLR